MYKSHIKRIIVAFMAIIFLFSIKAYPQATKSTHTVKPGETLYAISKMYGVSLDEIRQANPGITEAVNVGMELYIPTGGNSNIYHTIQPKETLYSISRKYNIDQDVVVKTNPGLSEQNFKIGTTIKIPVSRLEAARIDTSVVAAKPTGLAGTNCREIHISVKGETLEDITNKYGVEISELIASNPDIKKAADKKLPKGTYVCIPFVKPKQTNIIVSNPVRAQGESLLSKKDSYKILLLMPFYTDGNRSIEFYRGLLYSMNEIRKSGKNFMVEAHNAGQSVTDINKVLSKEGVSSANVIISSGSEAVSNIVAAFCKEHHIKMFLPFSTAFDAVYNNPYVTMGNMPNSYANAACVKYFLASLHGNANVVWFDGASQAEVSSKIIYELNSRNIAYTRVNAATSQTDFTNAFRADIPNVVFVSSQLKADYTALNAMLEKYKNNLTDKDFSIFGHDSWKDFDTSTRNSFYNWGVTICTPQFINVYAADYSSSRRFYIETFGKTPSTYAQRSFYLGIDCAKKLFGDKTSSLSKPFSFERVNTWGGSVNKAVRIVKFTKNHTIVINDYE